MGNAVIMKYAAATQTEAKPAEDMAVRVPAASMAGQDKMDSDNRSDEEDEAGSRSAGQGGMGGRHRPASHSGGPCSDANKPDNSWLKPLYSLCPRD